MTATELLAFVLWSNESRESDSPFLKGFSTVGVFDGFLDYKSFIQGGGDVGVNPASSQFH